MAEPKKEVGKIKRNQTARSAVGWSYSSPVKRCSSITAASKARASRHQVKAFISLTFADPADYEKIHADDRISIVGLAGLAPGRQLEAVIHHTDGSEERIRLNHSLNAEQVGWFRAGSALNVLRTR